MLPLQALTPLSLVREVPGVTLEEARKIVSAVHRDLSLDEPRKGVRRAALDLIRAAGYRPRLEIVRELASGVDPFVKLALRAPDGIVIETVRIPLEKPGRFSVCVSSQAGCALGCVFCATGRMGLQRNLETWEIVEQVRVVQRTLSASVAETTRSARKGARIHGVVFQGMGEPLANLDHVLETLAVLTEPCALAIDARKITVCTSGLPTGIVRLAREAPKVRLGLSIGSARARVRRTLMPIDAAHPLEDVIDACVEHARLTGLAPMWAVTPLAGVNDTAEDAARLAELAQSFLARTGLRPRISLIPYNSILGDSRPEVMDPFARPSAASEAAFREAIREGGFGTHKRYSGGGDVAAGCGQLAGEASPAGSLG
jgi:23S rRNA (adenine2503-C2)-methyltransferase